MMHIKSFKRGAIHAEWDWRYWGLGLLFSIYDEQYSPGLQLVVNLSIQLGPLNLVVGIWAL